MWIVEGMSDPTNEEQTAAVGTPLSEAPTHVRVGGQAGVRVVQGGELQHKRVSAIQESDHKQVPLAVLEAVRDLLEPKAEGALTAAERLLAARDLLTAWL